MPDRASTAEDSPDGGRWWRGLGAVSTLLPAAIRRSYLRKFAVAVSLVVLAVSLIGLNAYLSVSTTLDSQVAEDLQTTAETEAEDISRWRTQQRIWITMMSRSWGLQSESDRAISAFLTRDLKDVPADVSAVHYVDINSTRIEASSVTLAEGQRLAATTPWRLRDLLPETRDAVAATGIYRDGTVPVMAYVTRIPERPDVAVVSIVETQSPVRRFENSRDGPFTVVVDRNGTIIMDQRGQAFVGTQYTDQQVMAQVRTNPNRDRLVQATPEQGNLDRSYVAAIAPVNGTDWVVISHSPRVDSYQIRRAVLSHLLWILGAALVGLAFIGLVIGGSTVRSLEQLTTKVNALEDGNLDVELSTARDDEIGRLYEGFDQMRQSLTERIRELDAARSEAEAATQRAQERSAALERQNERLDKFASVISHDLRNPLGVARMYLDFARDTGDEADFEEVVHALDRMDEMIDELLTMARAGTELDDIDTLDLSSLVSAAWDTAQTGDATLDNDVPPEATVEADPVLLQNVFENLFRNSVDHNDGSVTVRVGTLDRGFYVEDDGAGIPEADRETIFDHGYTTSDEGTGFGLSIVSEIVDAHDWEITVTESEHGGARFEIRT